MWKRRSLKRSQKAAHRRRNFKILRASFGIVALVACIYSFASISQNPIFFIEKVSLEGNVFLSLTDVRPIIFDNISGNHFGLFSKQNILLYPKGKIEKEILLRFPRVESIKVRIEGINNVAVLVKERLPEGIWCENAQEEAPCFFLDKDGFIFAKSPSFTSDVYVRFLGELSEEEPLRSIFLSGNFPRLLSFTDGVAEIGLKPISVEIMPNNDGILRTDKGEILFTLERNLVEILENLKTFWRENSDTLPRFEYLDLRFGNKIFYK